MKSTIIYLQIQIVDLERKARSERNSGHHFMATATEKVIKNLNRLIKLARLIYPN